MNGISLPISNRFYTACLCIFILSAKVGAAPSIPIAAIGDSITAAYPFYPGPANGCTNCRHIGYPHRFETKLDSRGGETTVFNYGIPGEGVESGSQRVGSVIAATNAEYVIFHEGTNSLLYMAPSTVASWVGVGLNNILKNGRIPIATTILPDTRKSNENWKGIPEANVGIRQRAIDNNIILVDFYNALPNPFSDWKSHLIDGLHPNDSGFELMANLLVDEVDELLTNKARIVPPILFLLMDE